MAGSWQAPAPRFGVLRFMAALRAAREFGLDETTANAIAVNVDPGGSNVEQLVDLLAVALIERNALRLPQAI